MYNLQMRELKFLPTSADEWLIPKEALIAVSILENANKKEFLEIGVLKGAWSLNLLKNVKSRGTGVDPYPNLTGMRTKTLQRLKQYDYKLVSCTSEINPADMFDLIHVDGLHTYDAIKADLALAASKVTNEGVIAIDDIWHPSFPGIAAGFFPWLISSDFAAFLITGSKVYICRKECHERWYRHFESQFELFHDFPWERYYGEGKNLAYISVSEIDSFPNLLSTERYAPSRMSKLLPDWPDQATIGAVYQSGE